MNKNINKFKMLALRYKIILKMNWKRIILKYKIILKYIMNKINKKLFIKKITHLINKLKIKNLIKNIIV